MNMFKKATFVLLFVCFSSKGAFDVTDSMSTTSTESLRSRQLSSVSSNSGGSGGSRSSTRANSEEAAPMDETRANKENISPKKKRIARAIGGVRKAKERLVTESGKRLNTLIRALQEVQSNIDHAAHRSNTYTVDTNPSKERVKRLYKAWEKQVAYMERACAEEVNQAASLAKKAPYIGPHTKTLGRRVALAPDHLLEGVEEELKKPSPMRAAISRMR